MGVTGHCVAGNHEKCPDTHNDTYSCDCPCHLWEGPGTPTEDEMERYTHLLNMGDDTEGET